MHLLIYVVNRAAASIRVGYYSSFATRVLVNLYFRLQISISGCSFFCSVECRLQSIDELLEFKETWGFVISFATCQPVEIDLNIYM